jgi:hypothetical protein
VLTDFDNTITEFLKKFSPKEDLYDKFWSLILAIKDQEKLNLGDILKKIEEIEAFKNGSDNLRLQVDRVLKRLKVIVEILNEAGKYSFEIFERYSRNHSYELIFYREYSKLLYYRSPNQFYTDILYSDDFRKIFGKIFISDCLRSYYATLGEDYVNALTGENLAEFLSSIKEVPMYRNSAGLTFSSLYVFINSNSLCINWDFTEDQIKAVSSI